jgi:hypothetical protein
VRRLAEGDLVVLDLAEEAIECHVTAVAGDEATLAPLAAADAAYIPSLGRAAALVFDSDGARVRVRGAVSRAPEEGRLRFLAGRGADLPQRRQAARAYAEVAVELTPLDQSGEPAGQVRRLKTTDVGIGGVGVRVGDWAPARDELFDLSLDLPDGAPLSATARVLRVADGVAGLELAHVAPPDLARLAAFLIARRAAP